MRLVEGVGPVCLGSPLIQLLVAWLVTLGLLGAMLMGIDKRRAVHNKRRFRESTLFAISLAGGFWGVLLGRFLFYHKTSKISFLIIVYGTAIAWALLIYRLVVLGGCLP